MALQEILMDFDDNDNPVISVKGVKGKACRALTADLEQKLGKVTSTETTPEYNEREVLNRATTRVSNQRR